MEEKDILDLFDRGWKLLVEQWLEKLREDGEIGILKEITYIKEKYGRIRIEGPFDDYFEELELLSGFCCQECGLPGRTRYDLGWYRTLCDKHYLEIKKNKSK